MGSGRPCDRRRGSASTTYSSSSASLASSTGRIDWGRVVRHRVVRSGRDDAVYHVHWKHHLGLRKMRKPPWMLVKDLALLPVVLLVGLYSAFGAVFLVIPGRVLQALTRVPRRLLGRFSRRFL